MLYFFRFHTFRKHDENCCRRTHCILRSFDPVLYRVIFHVKHDAFLTISHGYAFHLFVGGVFCLIILCTGCILGAGAFWQGKIGPIAQRLTSNAAARITTAQRAASPATNARPAAMTPIISADAPPLSCAKTRITASAAAPTRTTSLGLIITTPAALTVRQNIVLLVFSGALACSRGFLCIRCCTHVA